MIQDDSEMTPIGTNSRKLGKEKMDSSEKTTTQEDLLLVTNWQTTFADFWQTLHQEFLETRTDSTWRFLNQMTDPPNENIQLRSLRLFLTKTWRTWTLVLNDYCATSSVEPTWMILQSRTWNSNERFCNFNVLLLIDWITLLIFFREQHIGIQLWFTPIVLLTVWYQTLLVIVCVKVSNYCVRAKLIKEATLN